MAKYRSPFNSNEVWRPVQGYKGLYEVSDKGRVRSLKRYGRKNTILLNPKTRPDGYRMVCLRKESGKNCFVHRLVLRAFTENPNPEIYNQVNHINSIRSDNRIENLEWSNNSLNQRHSFKYGDQDNKGESHPSNKLNNEQVVKIKLALECGMSSSALSKIFDVSKSTIKDIRNARTWSHLKLKTV